MAYSFYLFDKSTWTEGRAGNFFETTSGSERMSGSTDANYGDPIRFNGYDGGQLVQISGNTLSDSTSSGSLTAPVTINGTRFTPSSGEVEMDLGFVLQDPATGTMYFVGYVTIDDTPVGSVISRGWNPAQPNVWQDSGPRPDTALKMAGPITSSSPRGNPFVNNTALGPRMSRSSFDPTSNDAEISSQSAGIIDRPTEVMCFAAGTLIRGAEEDRPVQDLAPGDLVWTRDNGLQPVRWCASTTVRGPALIPALRPIRIAAGALGQGCPDRDLVVSPQHRVVVRSAIAQRMFGAAEVLVAARHLLDLDGIAVITDATQVTYVHFLLDRHEVVLSNGALTESLYTGAQALRSLSQCARAEILALFPELQDADHVPRAARDLVPGRAARNLAARHHRNGQPLLSPDAAHRTI